MKALLLILLVSTFSLDSHAKEICNDSDKVYKICSSQDALYKKAYAKARAEKKPLLLVFGFEACPWCISLHRVFNNPVNKEKLSAFVMQEIDVKEKAKGGKSLYETLVKKYSGAKADGFPFLGVVDPGTSKGSFFNTGDLESNTATTKGHDLTKLFAALEKARALASKADSR